MASVGGLSSGAAGASSIRGFGGLASGLDRDALIESMTAATRNKIAVQKQNKQKLGWQQDALRSITSKLHEFSNKYMSYASDSNLNGSKLFSRNLISALGANSKYIGVSGTASSGSSISILGVKQLAQNAQLNTQKEASSQVLETGEAINNMDTKTDVNLVSGESIYITYGSSSYVVNLKDKTGHDYDTEASAAAAMNEALKNTSIGNQQTLADVMEVGVNADGTMKFINKDTKGNELKISGGTENTLQNLGFITPGEDIDELEDERVLITKEGLVAQNKPNLIESRSIAQQLGGKSISFVYNGKVKWIELQSEEELKGKTLEDVRGHLQKKLDEAFGKGRIKAELSGAPGDEKRKLSFSTTKPKTVGGEIVAGDPDTTSTLVLSAAEKGLLGNVGVFGADEGISNRVNLNSSILKSGLHGTKDIVSTDPATLKINGVDITGITWDSSVSDIINKINENKEAGVKISYQANTDRFVVSSTKDGASGQVKMEGKIADLLLGTTSTPPDQAYTVQEGKDAVFSVRYPGSNDVVEVVRGTNAFTMDGLNLTLKSAFGYAADGTLDSKAEAVTFNASVDSEKTSTTVKEMINAYNEILKEVNEGLGQKPNRDYAPLTDEQKEGMSEEQIEKWEKEAKKGTLFNDSDIRPLSDSLRFILPSSDRAAFANMGITVSTDYADRGKLVFNETKFKAALESDPDAVKNLFTRPEEKLADGTTIEGGLMVKMKAVTDKYASMTGSRKGILVERAGSIYAATSVLKNSLQKQMNGIDSLVDKLTRQLATEQDRYISQFTNLETMINQMNSQSSWLSQQG